MSQPEQPSTPPPAPQSFWEYHRLPLILAAVLTAVFYGTIALLFWRG